jgi:hypothetical protein
MRLAQRFALGQDSQDLHQSNFLGKAGETQSNTYRSKFPAEADLCGMFCAHDSCPGPSSLGADFVQVSLPNRKAADAHR